MQASIYPTGRLIALVGAGAAISLALGALYESWWISGFLWLASILLLMAIDLARLLKTGAATLNAHAPSILQTGETSAVTVQASFGDNQPRRIDFALGATDNILVEPETLTGFSDADLHFTLTPRRRGDASIEILWARWKSPMGLLWRQTTRRIDRPSPIMLNTNAARLTATRFFSRSTHQGESMQRDLGDGAELNALKEFTAGSDRRMIDWKQSARHGSLLTREYKADRNARVMLAIDTGRIMSEPVDDTPRVDHALAAALSIAWVGLKSGDRVGVFSFDSRPRIASGLAHGVHAFRDLQKLTSAIDYSTEETNYAASFTALLDRLERRSIVIVFTDFSDALSAELLIDNLRRLTAQHTILFVAFRDRELEIIAAASPQDGRSVARSVVAEATLDDRRAVLDRVRKLGVHVLETPPSHATAAMFAHYMAIRREFAR